MAAIPVLGPEHRAKDLIENAIEAHGAHRVLFRAFLAMLIGKKRHLSVDALDPHLRRDIGLPVEPLHHPLRGPHPF